MFDPENYLSEKIPSRQIGRSDVGDLGSQLLQVWDSGRLYRFALEFTGTHSYPSREYDIPPDRWFREAEHAHDVYHVVLYTSGQSVFTVGGRRYAARENVLAIVSPGVPHGFHAATPGSVTYIEVCFSLECDNEKLRLPFHRLLSVYAGYEIHAIEPSTTLTDPQAHTLYRMLDSLYSELDQDSPDSKLSASKTTVDILLFLVREICADGAAPEPSTDASLLAAKEEIEKRFNERLDRSSLAAVASLSVSQFHRAFKNEFGVTPYAYQRELRIRSAQRLLSTTNMLTKEIARRVGFDDAYHFSKAFKALAGISAREYRKLKSNR